MKIETATELPFQSMGRQLGKLMEQMQKGYFNFCPSETWTPNVNLYEAEDSYLVCVDLAGVDKEKIDLEVVDQQLTLRGTRTVPAHSDSEEQELQAASPAGPPDGNRPRPVLPYRGAASRCRAKEDPRELSQRHAVD